MTGCTTVTVAAGLSTDCQSGSLAPSASAARLTREYGPQTARSTGPDTCGTVRLSEAATYHCPFPVRAEPSSLADKREKPTIDRVRARSTRSHAGPVPLALDVAQPAMLCNWDASPSTARQAALSPKESEASPDGAMSATCTGSRAHEPTHSHTSRTRTHAHGKNQARQNVHVW
jgi:hypothetical protein